MKAEIEQKRTAIYRHFNANGSLLYVGISVNAAHRLYEHMMNSRWSDEIANVQIEWFDCRQEALNAEKQAIKEEKPLWNIVHNQQKKDKEKAKKLKLAKKPKPPFDYEQWKKDYPMPDEEAINFVVHEICREFGYPEFITRGHCFWPKQPINDRTNYDSGWSIGQ